MLSSPKTRAELEVSSLLRDEQACGDLLSRSSGRPTGCRRAPRIDGVRRPRSTSAARTSASLSWPANGPSCSTSFAPASWPRATPRSRPPISAARCQRAAWRGCSTSATPRAIGPPRARRCRRAWRRCRRGAKELESVACGRRVGAGGALRHARSVQIGYRPLSTAVPRPPASRAVPAPGRAHVSACAPPGALCE